MDKKLDDKELDKILVHCEALQEFGIEQDEDMMNELNAEINSRNDDDNDDE